jgi:hypothetical protein
MKKAKVKLKLIKHYTAAASSSSSSVPGPSKLPPSTPPFEPLTKDK